MARAIVTAGLYVDTGQSKVVRHENHNVTLYHMITDKMLAIRLIIKTNNGYKNGGGNDSSN